MDGRTCRCASRVGPGQVSKKVAHFMKVDVLTFDEHLRLFLNFTVITRGAVRS